MKSLTIELPDDLVELLEREQQRRGMDANDLLAWLVERGLANGTTIEPGGSTDTTRSDGEGSVPPVAEATPSADKGFADGSAENVGSSTMRPSQQRPQSSFPEDYDPPPPSMTYEEAKARLDRKLGPGEYTRPVPFAALGRSEYTDTARRSEEILREGFGHVRDR